MFHEDVRVAPGETLSTLAVAYGYRADDADKLWRDCKNAHLVAHRGAGRNLQAGDLLYVPIPWHLVQSSLVAQRHGVQIRAERDGELGTRLTWVQTIYQGNQPIGGTDPSCVDACPPDDDLPFYWTNGEITADPQLRRRFSDAPSRPPPSAAASVTRWRAVTSLAVVTAMRVSVWESRVWGFDLDPDGTVHPVKLRHASAAEVQSHLYVLRTGKGTGPVCFGAGGWTFRRPPR